MKYYLSIVAIFKNEKDILGEWLNHHHQQGVEHFYLIDNGSTDDYQSQLAPYRHLIDLVIDPKRYQQPDHYNNHFLRQIQGQSEWVMVIDLDEFVFSQPPFKGITNYLRSLDESIGQIYLPWKEFGSNGYLQPPAGCVSSLIRRKLYRDQAHLETHTKTIFRTRYVTRMWIHHSFIQTHLAKEITSDGRPKVNPTPYMAPISESILKRSALHCHHYYARSFEWYRQVKMTRGSASAPSDEKDLSLERFNQWNLETNQIIDGRNRRFPPCPPSLRAYYGCGLHYRDVTSIVKRLLYDSKQQRVIVKAGLNFNHLFGDPVPFVEKYLVICSNYVLTVYPEHRWGRCPPP